MRSKLDGRLLKLIAERRRNYGSTLNTILRALPGYAGYFGKHYRHNVTLRRGLRGFTGETCTA